MIEPKISWRPCLPAEDEGGAARWVACCTHFGQSYRSAWFIPHALRSGWCRKTSSSFARQTDIIDDANVITFDHFFIRKTCLVNQRWSPCLLQILLHLAVILYVCLFSPFPSEHVKTLKTCAIKCNWMNRINYFTCDPCICSSMAPQVDERSFLWRRWDRKRKRRWSITVTINILSERNHLREEKRRGEEESVKVISTSVHTLPVWSVRKKRAEKCEH